MAAGVLALATLAVLLSLAMAQEPVFGLGAIVLPTVAVAVLIVMARRRAQALIHSIPFESRPLVLATTLLPLFATAAALWLPEALIGYSEMAPWSYRVGWELSFVGPVMAGLAATALARRHGHRGFAMLAIGLVALSLSVAGRDIGVLSFDGLGPGAWCVADEVKADPNGVELLGDESDCPLLLGQR